jgi:hypothetical protein
MMHHLVRLQFQLIGAVRRKSAHPGPLKALVFHPGDGWQCQRRARTLGSGRFEVTLPAPGTGSCCLFLASAKPGGGYPDLPGLIIREWQDRSTRNLHSRKDRVFGAKGGPAPPQFVRKVVDRPIPMALKGRVAS